MQWCGWGCKMVNCGGPFAMEKGPRVHTFSTPPGLAPAKRRSQSRGMGTLAQASPHFPQTTHQRHSAVCGGHGRRDEPPLPMPPHTTGVTGATHRSRLAGSAPEGGLASMLPSPCHLGKLRRKCHAEFNYDARLAHSWRLPQRGVRVGEALTDSPPGDCNQNSSFA